VGAATINSFDYTYDKVGTRKTKADRNGSYTYTYDTLNRLTDAINPLSSNPLESYSYDPVGNRTNSNQNGPSSFNQANQLLEDANFNYQYDNNGNLIRKTNRATSAFTSYEYDAENRLVRVVNNGTAINYRYDGLGRRVEKEIIDAGTRMTRYVYDNEDILLELDGSNNIVARYTHGPSIDEPLIMEKGGASFFYHADGLGSITEISDADGTVKQRYAYSSFGGIESKLDLNFVQPYAFTARELDPETELHFYRARTYDSFTGRFLQEDPILHAGNSQALYGLPALVSDPLLLHTYAYVRNEPVDNVDPLGLAMIMRTGGLNGNFRSGFTEQDKICTVPAWLGFLNKNDCTQKCCLKHDNCYTRYRCNASSWFANPFANPGACQFCNSDAVHCVLTGLGRESCDCMNNE
jgi:RHS repeat-associated protein